jgi:hypothetical protein
MRSWCPTFWSLLRRADVMRDVFARRRVDLREIGWSGMDWIRLAQDRDQWRALVNMEMNLRVP